MSKVHVDIEIAAAPETVFNTVMDADRLSEWVTIHRGVKVYGNGKPVAGARMDQVLAIRGVPFTVRWTLTAVEAPNRAEWQGRGPAGSKALIVYEISGPEAGPSRFTYTNDFSTPGGPVGKAASRLVIGNTSQREAEQSLSRLKALLEGKRL